MQRFLRALTDWFIPEDIREFNQREEVARARMAVAALLMNVAIDAIGVLNALLHTGPRTPLQHYGLTATAATLIIYCLLLLGFRRFASFALTGNLYASTAFTSLLWGLLTLPEQAPTLIVLLLFIPLFANLMAGFRSGLSWTAVIAAVPLLLDYYWSRNGQPSPLSPQFAGIWLQFAALIAFVLYGHQHVTAQMAVRLNQECAQFAFDAAHDPLTGLANRATFNRRLQEAIEYGRLHQEKVALMYIDLNDFKPINDRFGHLAGDAMLVATAKRLLGLVRASDTVARLGGDEFAVLYNHVKQLSDLEPPIERIKHEIAKPLGFEQLQLQVSASIGVVAYPDHGDTPELLEQRADALMYEHKQRLKNLRADV